MVIKPKVIITVLFTSIISNDIQIPDLHSSEMPAASCEQGDLLDDHEEELYPNKYRQEDPSDDQDAGLEDPSDDPLDDYEGDEENPHYYQEAWQNCQFDNQGDRQVDPYDSHENELEDVKKDPFDDHKDRQEEHYDDHGEGQEDVCDDQEAWKEEQPADHEHKQEDAWDDHEHRQEDAWDDLDHPDGEEDLLDEDDPLSSFSSFNSLIKKVK